MRKLSTSPNDCLAMSAELVELQKTFFASMRGGVADNLMPALALGRFATPKVGLAIYQNAYSARLREALENDHPQLGKYLGDELWQQLCAGYIALHPSNVRSLRDFGASLPGYMTITAPFSDMPQTAELATFERRLLDCFDAADAPLATWQALLSLPAERWPNLCPQFHPSVQLQPVQWNSVEIWRALKAEQEPPELSPASAHWLLWRDQEQITRFRALGADEVQAYAHFCAGGDFASLCEALQVQHEAEAVPGLALGLLQRWCLEGGVSAWAPPFLRRA